MSIDVEREWIELQRLTTRQLRQCYLETFGEAVRSNNKTWLMRRILWRWQALAEGDLSERARQRAAELACDADLRLMAPRPGKFRVTATPPRNAHAVNSFIAPLPRDSRLPAPGSLLTRSYRGQTIEVKVLTEGFEYQGRIFSSLSALAKEITGTHCSGFRFFHLGRQAQGGGQ
jgi:hypothetical protein